ncbi:MAG TPA: hypothetical protein VJV22_02855, partial [Acidobacteriaceae bacterium]|nr:hypothetical protein [Acidobacteriaceae bacterium]
TPQPATSPLSSPSSPTPFSSPDQPAPSASAPPTLPAPCRGAPNSSPPSDASPPNSSPQRNRRSTTRYALVRTTWRFTFNRPQNATETIDSESIFLIDTGSDPFRILLYLTPRDILDTLRQRGITT